MDLKNSQVIKIMNLNSCMITASNSADTLSPPERMNPFLTGVRSDSTVPVHWEENIEGEVS